MYLTKQKCTPRDQHQFLFKVLSKSLYSLSLDLSPNITQEPNNHSKCNGTFLLKKHMST